MGFDADGHPFQDGNNMNIFMEPFCRGVNHNRSIRKITFSWMDTLGGEIFQSLTPFFKNNRNLSELWVERCQFGAGSARQLSLALRGCSKSLKRFSLYGNYMGDEPLVEILMR